VSTGRRAYDLLRSYVNREWERIQNVEQDSAERELSESLEGPAWRPSSTKPGSVTDTSMDPQQDTPEARARRILGVGSTAPFEEIRKSYKRLNERSSPAKFPPGSTEAAHAADIQKSVQWAYQTLTDALDFTQKRFKSLELD
jgi:hypothetical protein